MSSTAIFDRIVLMANDVDRLGGIGRFINEMAVGFHARGFEAELVGVAPPPKGHLQVADRPAGIVVRTLMPEPPPDDWVLRNAVDRKDRARLRRHKRRFELRALAVDKLRELITEWGPRTLIICTQVYGMEHLLEAGYNPSDKSHPRVIGQYHGSFDGAKTTGRDLSRVLKAYQDLERTVFLTAEDAESFRRSGLNNTAWIANPVAAPPAAKREEQQNTIVSLGRYDKQKALHLLIAAWSMVEDSLPKWNLELYGEGEERMRLQSQIDEGNIPRVRLMGKTDRVGDVLAASRIHAMSSVSEGLPIAIVEAGLLGVPTVSFDCAPGVRSLIDSGRTGMVITANSVASLADSLLELASDEDRLSQMSKACAQDMRRYEPQAIIDQWEQLFAEMAR